MSSSKTILITGAARGIGREMVNQYAQDPNYQVIANVRKPVNFGLPNVKVVTFDQSSTSSIEAAAKQIPELDVLIINGAIGADELLLSTSEDRFQEYLNTNVVGVLRIVKAFLPALRARKTRRIAVISSTSGSNTRQIGNKMGFRGPYSVTKAADNMMVVQLHNELHESEGFDVVTICPGWVATDMGNAAGDGGMPPSKSVNGIRNIVDNIKPEDSAKFFRFDNEIVPW